LILDWPFDFIGIQGSSTDEIEVNKFKWAVNMTARVERLRDFVGLDNANLLRIVARAADIMMGHTAAGKKPSPEMVQHWLQQHVKWGCNHCPDIRAVKRHMDNWAAIQTCPAASDLIDAALNRWGRDNLLDWPTKLGLIVQKTDSTSLVYVIEALYARMWRTGQKDPYSTGRGGLADVIDEILWGKIYLASFLRKYPDVFSTCCNSDASTVADSSVTAAASVAAANTIQTIKSYFDSPLKLFRLHEGPDRDPTWVQNLPNEALRLMVKHHIEIAQGFYKSEILCALKQPKADRYNVDQFHKGTRVSGEAFLGAFPDRVRFPRRGIVQGSRSG
jgi:hypothetical protein